MKLLGHKWGSKNDILYPGFAELDLNKKVRGAKKSNIVPVVTLKDAGRLLDSVTLTQRIVVSIMAVWLLLSTNDDLRKYQFSCSREVHGSRAVHDVRYKLGLAEIFLFPYPAIFVYKTI